MCIRRVSANGGGCYRNDGFHKREENPVKITPQRNVHIEPTTRIPSLECAASENPVFEDEITDRQDCLQYIKLDERCRQLNMNSPSNAEDR